MMLAAILWYAFLRGGLVAVCFAIVPLMDEAPRASIGEWAHMLFELVLGICAAYLLFGR